MLCFGSIRLVKVAEISCFSFVMWPRDFVGVVSSSWVTTQLSLRAIGLIEVEIMALIVSFSISIPIPIPIPMPSFQYEGLQMAVVQLIDFQSRLHTIWIRPTLHYPFNWNLLIVRHSKLKIVGYRTVLHFLTNWWYLLDIFCFPTLFFLPCRIRFIHFYFQLVEKFEPI